MPKQAFADTLKRTREELDVLRRRRADLDERISKLEQVEFALSGVIEPESQTPDLSSITTVVRRVLKFARQPLTPTAVRDEMVAIGFDPRPYRQFLAAVHVILKRLAKKGQVFEFSFADGKRYWWTTKAMPGGSSPENAMLARYFNSQRLEDLKTSMTYDEAKAKEAAKSSR